MEFSKELSTLIYIANFVNRESASQIEDSTSMNECFCFFHFCFGFDFFLALFFIMIIDWSPWNFIANESFCVKLSVNLASRYLNVSFINSFVHIVWNVWFMENKLEFRLFVCCEQKTTKKLELRFNSRQPTRFTFFNQWVWSVCSNKKKVKTLDDCA